MKKILLVIAILTLLVPTAARAYVDYYRHYVFFHQGLGTFTVEKEKEDCEYCQDYIIKGPGAENIQLSNTDGRAMFVRREKDKIDIQFKNVGWNDYKFWKLKGSFKETTFVLYGLTIEGDIIENKIILPIGLIVCAPIIFLYIFLKRKKNKNIV